MGRISIGEREVQAGALLAIAPQTGPVPHSAAPDEIALLSRLGRALHRFGAPAHRLEDALDRVSRRLGVHGQFFSTPTAFFASFDAPGTTVLVEELLTRPSRWPASATVLCYAVASAAAARFFGGGWRELLAAGLGGLVIGIVGRFAARAAGHARLFEPASAFLVSLLVVALASVLHPLAAALLVAPLAFVVLFRARAKDAPWIVLAGVTAFASARAGAHLLGPELGTFAGAVVAGAFGNLYANARRGPASVPIVPGLMMLVPGSFGFRSLSSLLARDVLSGLETAFLTVLVAVALGTGLLVANVLVPPRRAL